MAEAPVPKVPTPDAVREPGAAAGWHSLLKLSRPRQWTKNSLLFAALIFAERLFDAEAVLLALLAFAAFCLASSSVYVVNDWVDADRDRLHPDKRHRPIASGQTSKGVALAWAVGLTVVSLGLAFEVSRRAELFLTVGTSAVVHPAASLPRLAREAGAWVVEVNPEETALTAATDEHHRGTAARVLPELLGEGV